MVVFRYGFRQIFRQKERHVVNAEQILQRKVLRKFRHGRQEEILRGPPDEQAALVGLEDGDIVIDADGGEPMRFAQKDVAIVRPLIEFDEEDLLDEAPGQDLPR